MGSDLALFLAVLGGLVASGDLVSWSMGGTPPVTPGGPADGLVGGVVGGITGDRGDGLTGTVSYLHSDDGRTYAYSNPQHNKYENDVSPTRPDLYESGENFITQSSQFQDMINASPGGEVTMDSLTTYRSERFDHQIANNPEFFNAPFSGLLVQPGESRYHIKYS